MIYKLLMILVLLTSDMVVAEETNNKLSLKQDSETQRMFQRSSEVKFKNSGEAELNTKGGFRSVTLTRINSAGETETFCTSSIEKAQRFLDGENLDVLTGEVK